MKTCFMALVIFVTLQAFPAAATTELDAEELIKAWGCRSCHAIKGSGGSNAPDLSRVGQRLNAVDIRLRLKPLRGQKKSALMPTFPEMPDAEVRILSEYLAGLK